MIKEVEITSLIYGGRGLGRIDGKVVFVPFAVPGDSLKVRITKEKKSFAEGEIVEIIKPSKDRVEPECGVFGRCGGCAWQNISYPVQLEWKLRIFRETLERIGGVEFNKPVEAAQAGEPYNYRSRVKFQIDNDKWGFFAAQSHSVVDIESCPLLDPRLNETFAALKGFFKSRKHGLVSLGIALSEGDSKTVASFYSVGRPDFETDEIFALSGLLKGFEVYRSNGKGGRRSANEGGYRRTKSRGGRDMLLKVRGMDLKAPSGSFTQVNPSVNEQMIEKLLEIGEIRNTDRVLDLFCGIGNLTIPLGISAAGSHGVESDKRAIEYARGNVSKSSLRDIVFDCEDVPKWLKSKEIKSLARPFWDVVVLDPPRGGDFNTVKSLVKIAPEKIIYVSCSPPTLARDISFLRENGYGISRAVVLDMFPQTFHIESVIVLERG